MDVLSDLRQQLADKLITQAGYVLAAIALLQVDDPLGVDRKWLADQLGLSYGSTSNVLYKLQKMGKFSIKSEN